MPAELLRDVVQASRSVPARRLSMLPLSIGAHVAAALAILIIPLAAEVDLPVPAPLSRPDYMAARSVPPPPPAPAPPGARAAAQRDAGAPVVAPMTIAEERERPPAVAVPEGLAVIGGIDSGSGYVGGLGPTIAVEPPAPSTAAPTPVRPGGDVREPKKIFDVVPVYPALARAGRIEGIVILDAVINVRGEVERLRVLRSMPLLDAAAVDAVQRWRYTPTLLNGVPVPVLLTITVRFTLRD